jgi:NACHT domain
MANTRRAIDKVRASRDGHEFHEAWAARKALQLLLPTDKFVGIAVEGLSPVDQANAPAGTVEIADLVLYYGAQPTFDASDSVVILQFKYSIGKKNVPFRQNDARKTIQKFAAVFRDHRKQYGEERTGKVQFELITNRPIYRALDEAILSIADGRRLKGEARKQGDQFKSACGLKGKDLVEFARKTRITGLAGNLTDSKRSLSRILAGWSAAPDAMARARLGALKQLIRDKAGSAGDYRNVIRRTDVFDALEVQGPDELFPSPASFPEIGKVVEREQLLEVAELIPKLGRPLLVHAPGGVGKTVFFQSLSKILGERHKTILFDCFGGGAYRAPEDARHLPKRGLIHIINNLACEGFCDPLLPGNDNIEELVKAFRRRLSQTVDTLRRGSADTQLLLFIDAIDNAAEHAKDRSEPSFPNLILESIHHGGRVPGVQLIVSCRTERRGISIGQVLCDEVKLQPFSQKETREYLCARIQGVTETQVNVAYARSGGNPRILEHLAFSDRGLLDASEIKKTIDLDDLLKKRIQEALGEAQKRGYKEPDIRAFLAGLAILPPPVPVKEYAEAHHMDVSAIESFAADLAPLLERTKLGLMFRDEPTETLIRDNYAADMEALRGVARNLFEKQDSSVYAASALPALLQKIDDGESLFKLAFDDRFPQTITSTVGKQNIRYSRLKAAVLHAAARRNYDRLVHLLVELSTIAAINQRGTDYIEDNPNLVVASQDIDATRRLFETRTHWPGTRHARLAVAHLLSGELNEAYRHVVSADEWIFHYRRQDEKSRHEKGGPERLDIAAIPLCLIAQNRARHAISYLRGWNDWYAYEVCEHLFALLDQSQRAGSIPGINIKEFLDTLKFELGALASAISFLELDTSERRRLVRQLAKACKRKRTIDINTASYPERNYVIQDGLLKASAIAVSMNLCTEALIILSVIPQERPGVWSFNDHFSNRQSFPFVFHSVITAVAQGKAVTEATILPKELVKLSAAIPIGTCGTAFRKALTEELEARYKAQSKIDNDKKSISYELKQDIERFLNERMESLLKMAQAFASLLSSTPTKSDKAFLQLVEVWTELRKKRDDYSDRRRGTMFFDLLGRELVMFALWTWSDLKTSSVKQFMERLSQGESLPASILIAVISVLAKRDQVQDLAGAAAIRAKDLIEREDEVGYRASLYAQLAQAILPASKEEASTYFRAGLEQMDAIGSGDYQFTNELLLFAASLKGDELEERDFHTLTNICELNMPSEEEKFPWFAFARGLSKAAGCRALAKLGRWDDRAKVALEYTLLPYLTALIEHEKIEPETALGLLRLSDPAELYSCGTGTFAKAIHEKKYANEKSLLSELVQHYQDNNPGFSAVSAVEGLRSVAEEVFGKDAKESINLTTASSRFAKLRDERNDQVNYHGKQDPRLSTHRLLNNARENQRKLKQISARTDPSDDASMSFAIDAMNELQYIYDLKSSFFNSLRNKLSFSERPKYIRIIGRLDNLDIYTKLYELKECKEKWSGSSAALEVVYRELATSLIQIHSDDFVSHDYLSGSDLKDISDLSGIPIPILALELIRIFAAPDSHLPASVWMALASIVCNQAKDGEGQVALKRLLNSNAARLSSSVVDGDWRDGLYPNSGETEIAEGLIWFKLGSPAAADRWRASHATRCFARFGKWDVIDALVSRMHSKDAAPFQAPELAFYFLHAKLWLLIALARIALDHPSKVARYEEVLKAVALDSNVPHAVMRHFASQALSICAKSGHTNLSASEITRVENVNSSPFPRVHHKDGPHRPRSGQEPRLTDTARPKLEFHLDYDFEKYDVQGLSRIFGRSSSEVEDAISRWVRTFDQSITSMYASGGRSTSYTGRMNGMTSHYHLYGQQLGWNCLCLAAGEFLAKYPVTDDFYHDDPWPDWLSRRVLTRKDGLWLADGIDPPPLQTQINLLEKGDKGLVITGDKGKLLALVGIHSHINDEFVVEGDWSSPDSIGVHISSALVSTRKSRTLATQLLTDEPFFVWLPVYEKYGNEDEYQRNEKENYEAWVVRPTGQIELDEDDPIGASSAMSRPHFTKAINALQSLKSADCFNRAWLNSDGECMAHAEGWRRIVPYREDGSRTGQRLVCSASFLRHVLAARRADLLLLIKLERYEKGVGNRDSHFFAHNCGCKN